MVDEHTLDPGSHDAQVFSARAILTLAESGIAATRIIDEVSNHGVIRGNGPMLAVLTLWLGGPMRPSDLADALAMTTGASTKIVAKLEKAGLVSKTADPEDGRAITVALTSEGRQAVEVAATALVPVAERAVRHLSALHTLAE